MLSINNLCYDHPIKLIYEKFTPLYNRYMQGYKDKELTIEKQLTKKIWILILYKKY